jgi:AcrR family transcriptional regulator
MDSTRAAIVTAASTLAATGTIPTVREAAEAAGVSRATAYRYFRNQDALALALELELPLEQFDEQLRATESRPLPERAGDIVEIIASGTYRFEAVLRDRLRAALGTAGDRPGHPQRSLRSGVTAAVLRPLRDELSASGYERISALLDLLMGIESVIVMSDIAGLEQDEAIAALSWAARTLVAAQMEESMGAR